MKEFMMKMKSLLVLSLLLCAVSVQAQKAKVEAGTELRSLVETEREFSKTSATEGTRAAFLLFLDDGGIVFQPGPVNGKKSWTERKPGRGLLTWQPVYADISRAGDLGYTTGPWEFRKSSPDEKPAAFGDYMTIWKHQPDGTWKFVLDFGSSHPQPTSPATPWQLPANYGKGASKAASQINVETERAALLERDSDFARATLGRGAVKAYDAFANDDLRFFRNEAFVLTNKAAVRAALSAKVGTLNTQPTHADVSSSGDLGYTYGTYEFKANGAAEGKAENGNYVRVWKKGADKKWKVVVDVMNPLPPSGKQ
jgi:ketosteroid isomerase-like protein